MKPRSDSKLKLLSPEMQEQIFKWCNTPKTEDSPGGYEHAREQLASDGIRTSIGALSEFWGWYGLQLTFQRADSFAQDIEEMLKRELPTADLEKIAKAGQLVFTMEAANARNAEEFRDMEYLRLAKETASKKGQVEDAKIDISKARITQKDREIELAERRVKLLEENAEKAKTLLETVRTKGGLTPETLAQIEEAARLL